MNPDLEFPDFIKDAFYYPFVECLGVKLQGFARQLLAGSSVHYPVLIRVKGFSPLKEQRQCCSTVKHGAT
jgi:hypothetical protein